MRCLCLNKPFFPLKAGQAVDIMRTVKERQAECIFDHMEKEYPSFFDPACPPTHDSSGLDLLVLPAKPGLSCRLFRSGRRFF